MRLSSRGWAEYLNKSSRLDEEDPGSAVVVGVEAGTVEVMVEEEEEDRLGGDDFWIMSLVLFIIFSRDVSRIRSSFFSKLSNLVERLSRDLERSIV